MSAKFQQGPWMDTTRILIEEVRKYRCLYDKSDRRYKDHRSKPPIWAAIAQKTRYRKGRDALNKWNYLRKHYATLLRRVHESLEEEGGTVDESSVHIAWDHFERMSFLRPFIKTFPLEDSAFQDDETDGTPQPDGYKPPPRGALFEDDDENDDELVEDESLFTQHSLESSRASHHSEVSANSGAHRSAIFEAPRPQKRPFAAIQSTSSFVPPKAAVQPSASASIGAQLFAHYVGERLAELPVEKRRATEREILRLLDDDKKQEGEPAVEQKPLVDGAM
ncbi:hypothetical protein M3Y99_01169300 [Aphelenchoides fujianensis]|nr:hypothetical protein M3Y99_01169300 [Aphelenchoides fujianensis]